MCERDTRPGGVCWVAVMLSIRPPLPLVEVNAITPTFFSAGSPSHAGGPTQLSYRICGSHFG
jgi:hypothetical protein